VTKLDVLNELPEIKIGVAYEVDGRRLDSFPADLTLLSRVTVVYETHPGWQSEISHCRTFAELPTQAQAYVRRIEQLVGVPGTGAPRWEVRHAHTWLNDRRAAVRWIGVGPARDAMIAL
jgi:adenylosuccinate synthase